MVSSSLPTVFFFDSPFVAFFFFLHYREFFLSFHESFENSYVLLLTVDQAGVCNPTGSLTCNRDGSYASKQCGYNWGRVCWCVDAEGGEIANTRTKTLPDQLECDEPEPGKSNGGEAVFQIVESPNISLLASGRASDLVQQKTLRSHEKALHQKRAG